MGRVGVEVPGEGAFEVAKMVRSLAKKAPIAVQMVLRGAEKATK